MFEVSAFYGAPLDVEAHLALPIAAPVPRAAPPPAAAPGSNRKAAAAALRAAWPSSGRHLAQLALAGACIRGGWSDEDTIALLVDISGDPAKRAATVAATRAAHDAGTPYTGFAALADHVGAKVVDAARKLLGLSDEATAAEIAQVRAAMEDAPPAPGNRRQRRAAHKYTHDASKCIPAKELKAEPMSNMIFFLVNHSDWAGVWQYNEFKRTIVAVNPPMKLDAETTGLSGRDATAIRTWFESKGIKVTRETGVVPAIEEAARARSFHPVREYLCALPRVTSTPLLDTLAARVLGNASPLAATFLKLFLVAAVRRILVPGTKVDTMLVLYSPKEGRFKSTFVEVLFGKDWFRDQMPSLDGRDASHALEGCWGIEIPELDRIMRAETSTTKEFLSRHTDKYRAYGNGQKVEFPRECVFIGTTNYPDILESDTGNRRFWIIEVFGAIGLDFIREYRDAIWAEAMTLALDPTVKHWLDETQEAEANEARGGFDKRDPWHAAVEDYCAGREEVSTAEDVYLERIAVGDDSALSKVDRRHALRIGAILRKLGCKSDTKRSGGKVVRYWLVPVALRKTAPSNEEAARRAARTIMYS